jgi:PIN domain nuclease of toxin-antitoxin system
MDLLLDTHVFLCWNGTPAMLRSEVREAIRDPANSVYVSAASIWEIAIKRRLGRLEFTNPIIDAIVRNGFSPLPISPHHAEHAGSLPLLHTDPFDRMLIAQAQLDSLTLVTADARITSYAVAQLKAR